jgi:hypothetical protein
LHRKRQQDWLAIIGDVGIGLSLVFVGLLPSYHRITHSNLSFTPELQNLGPKASEKRYDPGNRLKSEQQVALRPSLKQDRRITLLDWNWSGFRLKLPTDEPTPSGSAVYVRVSKGELVEMDSLKKTYQLTSAAVLRLQSMYPNFDFDAEIPLEK